MNPERGLLTSAETFQIMTQRKGTILKECLVFFFYTIFPKKKKKRNQISDRLKMKCDGKAVFKDIKSL